MSDRLPARLRSPAFVLLVLGTIAGTAMAFGVPRLAGIDEPYHYLRAWSISDGTLTPETGPLPGDRRGGGLCIPSRVLDDLFALRRPYLERLIPGFDGADPVKTTPTCPAASGTPGASGAPGATPTRFVDVATFAWYTPLSYAPAAAGVGLGRVVGLGVAGQLLLARLATLATYLALCLLAVRIAPRCRWALVVVALLPVSLFQAATSLSPDALTLAAVLLVVAVALRALEDRTGLSERRLALESLGASALLAVSKPTYIVVGLVFLAAVLARRSRWPVLIGPAVGVAISAAWYGHFRSQFVCDTRYFGVVADPNGQTSRLLHAPWRLGGSVLGAFVDHGGSWTRDLIGIGDRIVPWGVAACAVVAVALAAVALAPDGHPLAFSARLVFVGTGVVCVAAVLAGWLISCNAPTWVVTSHPHARLLAPALAPLLVGLTPPARRRTSWLTAAVAPVLAIVLIAWTAAMLATMH